MSRAKRDAKRELAKEQELAKLRAKQEKRAAEQQALSDQVAAFKAKRAAMTPDQRARHTRKLLVITGAVVAVFVGLGALGSAQRDDPPPAAPPVEATGSELAAWWAENEEFIGTFTGLVDDLATDALDANRRGLERSCERLDEHAMAGSDREPPGDRLAEVWRGAMRHFGRAGVICADAIRRDTLDRLETASNELDHGARLLAEVGRLVAAAQN